MNKFSIKARIDLDGRTFEAVGREAWALANLVRAGERGCTPIDTPGPRWSHYVFLLRKRGLAVETIYEAHKGPFPGTHARYVLRTKITILDETALAA